MHIRSMPLAVFLSLTCCFPFAYAQETKPYIGKWVGNADLAKKHYKDLAEKHFKEHAGKKTHPKLLDSLKSTSIEFKADNTYVMEF